MNTPREEIQYKLQQIIEYAELTQKRFNSKDGVDVNQMIRFLESIQYEAKEICYILNQHKGALNPEIFSKIYE